MELNIINKFHEKEERIMAIYGGGDGMGGTDDTGIKDGLPEIGLANNPNVPAPTATFPIERIFANGNSMPITKSNNITPMSAKRFNADMSDKIPIPSILPEGGPPSGSNHAHNGDKGPINIPTNR